MALQPITAQNAAQLTPLQQAQQGWIAQVIWSPNGKLIACASASGVNIWRGTLHSKPLHMQPHAGPVKGIAFAPNGTTFATASADTTVKVWDLRAFSPTMQPLETYTAHTDAVERVAIAQNGVIVTASVDQSVRLLHPSQQRALSGHLDEVNTLALSADSRIAATGGHDSTVRLWDVASGAALAVLTGHTSWVRVLDFHPREPLLLSSSRDGSVRVWDVSDTDNPQEQAAFWHEGDVRAAAFDAAGALIASGSTSGTINIWDVERGERVAVLEQHTMPVISLAFHPQNHLLLSGGGDNRLYLWGIETEAI